MHRVRRFDRNEVRDTRQDRRTVVAHPSLREKLIKIGAAGSVEGAARR
jgi:hypothetical protein